MLTLLKKIFLPIVLGLLLISPQAFSATKISEDGISKGFFNAIDFQNCPVVTKSGITAQVDMTACTGGGGGDITAVGDVSSGAAFTAGVPGQTLTFKNATSGTVTLQTVTGALGSVTASLPAETGTICTTGSVCTGYQASGSYLSNVVEDTTPQLGGDLDLNSHVITGLVIGTNVQAYDADLTTYAGITPSANVQSLLGAANYAAIKALLDVDDLITLSGVSAGAVNLGTFTGSTISDNGTIKAALQELETGLEGVSGGGAPTDATYITQTANGTLSNEQALGSLATGILKNTTTTGVLSIATAGTDYTSPSSTETMTNKTMTSPTINTPSLILADGNGAAPTTDGQIKYDRTTERLQVGDGSTTSEFVKVGTLTDTKACIWDSASKSIVCNSSGGSDTNAAKVFTWPASATLPVDAADSIPPIGKDAGTNIDMLYVAFDDSTDECRSVSFRVPPDITSGNVTFKVDWYSAAATTGAAAWDFRHNGGVTTGTDPDQSLTLEFIESDTTAGTAGQLNIASGTETVANLGWSADELVYGVFCRDGNGTNGTDDLTGDALAIEFTIEIPRA